MAYTCVPVPAISQIDVQCSVDHLTRWLNNLAEEHNNLCSTLAAMDETVDSLLSRVCLLEKRVDDIESDISDIRGGLTEINNKLTEIENKLAGYDIAISQIQSLFDTITELLPIPYGMISAGGYKIAIGNIDVLNGYNKDRSRTYGIYTSVGLAGTEHDVYHDDKIMSYLPVEYSVMDSKNYKIAVGNINVLSANGGTPSTNVGIITSSSIENNDVYFN